MTFVLRLQLVAFVAAVLVCIAWTKLVYYDGLHQKLERLRRHCMIHAGMIASVSAWAMSMGFSLHHSTGIVIQDQQQTIQNLATGRLNHTGENHAGMAQQITNAMAYKTIEVTTPNGTKVSFGGDGRAAIRSGLFGSGSERRSSSGSGGCSSCESWMGDSGIAGVPVPGIGSGTVF